MDFKIIEIFTRCISIERINDDKFETAEAATVLINGKPAISSNLNVITVSGLTPDTEYEISLEGKSQVEKFTTGHESYILNVKDFGAVGDGVHPDANAIQAAIMTCPKDGCVYVPAGKYYCTPIFLKSDMTFWVDDKAVIYGDTDRTHYPILPGVIRNEYDNDDEISVVSWEGNPLDSFASLIMALDCKNLDIIGGGEINGNADKSDWWVDVRNKRIAWRPKLLSVNNSCDVRVCGLHLKNSAAWCVHPYYSDRLKFINLEIWNPSNSPNTDGFDPESCTDVLLLGTKISVGDDCIAIKSGKIYMATYHYKETDGIEVRNCRLERGHGSVTVGSEVAGGVRGVRVSKCVFSETDRGLRIKTRRGRGERSYITDLRFEDLVMDRVHMPITVNMFYFCDPDGHTDYVQNQNPFPVDYRTPKIGSITVKDVVCTGVDASFVCANGLPESPIEKIELDNCKVSYLPEGKRTPQCPIMMDGFPKLSGVGVYLKNVKEAVANNVSIEGSIDNAPTVENVSDNKLDIKFI
ncbi:MAG: glycoside hydrolase family 28 protein [Lachnospiraceae bacterium]|nr:glycoside hydrolase family 28 protein [Lachnospiraceae bacterium]